MKTDAQFCFDELMDTADKLRGIMIDGNEDQVEALSAFQNCMLSAFVTKFSEDSGLNQSQTLTLYHATKEFVLQMAMIMEGM